MILSRLFLNYVDFILYLQLSKEKKSLDERLQDAEATLTEEEEKSKGLMKLKARYESSIGELEDKLHKEEKVRNSSCLPCLLKNTK